MKSIMILLTLVGSMFVLQSCKADKADEQAYSGNAKADKLIQESNQLMATTTNMLNEKLPYLDINNLEVFEKYQNIDLKRTSLSQTVIDQSEKLKNTDEIDKSRYLKIYELRDQFNNLIRRVKLYKSNSEKCSVDDGTLSKALITLLNNDLIKFSYMDKFDVSKNFVLNFFDTKTIININDKEVLNFEKQLYEDILEFTQTNPDLFEDDETVLKYACQNTSFGTYYRLLTRTHSVVKKYKDYFENKKKRADAFTLSQKASIKLKLNGKDINVAYNIDETELIYLDTGKKVKKCMKRINSNCFDPNSINISSEFNEAVVSYLKSATNMVSICNEIYDSSNYKLSAGINIYHPFSIKDECTRSKLKVKHHSRHLKLLFKLPASMMGFDERTLFEKHGFYNQEFHDKSDIFDYASFLRGLIRK